MKVIRALLIVLAISVCAFAGDMPNDKDGNMPNERAGEMPNEKTGITDPLEEIALHLLQSVLPLF
ncbi:MAG: hypothetical protein ACREBG_17310 [Pyrinomonadaceae bacterium]